MQISSPIRFFDLSLHEKVYKKFDNKTGMNQIWDICGFVERNLLLEATLVRSFANCDPEWSEH